MKYFWMTVSPLILGLALTAFGQTAGNQAQPGGNGQPAAQAQGRGRAGAPFAWGDKNKDGVCDVTGRPVGQGRGQMAQGGRRGGRGMRGRCGCRGGRGGNW